jgi:hypothetical protein
MREFMAITRAHCCDDLLWRGLNAADRGAMCLQALFFFRVFFTRETDTLDFRLAVRRPAGLDMLSVFATTLPSVEPMVSARLARRPLSFLAAFLTRLFSIFPLQSGARNDGIGFAIQN